MKNILCSLRLSLLLSLFLLGAVTACGNKGPLVQATQPAPDAVAADPALEADPAAAAVSAEEAEPAAAPETDPAVPVQEDEPVPAEDDGSP